MEAVRRIGLAPNVSSHTPAHQTQIGQQIIAPSNLPISPMQQSVGRTASNHPYLNPAPAQTVITDSSSDAAGDVRGNGSAYNTAPTGIGRSNIDEFGARARGQSIEQPQTFAGVQSGGSVTARPRSSGRGASTGSRPLTVMNFAEDMPEEVKNQNLTQLAARQQHQRNPSLGGSRPSTANKSGWTNAEDEKRMLYERAKAQVEQTQGSVARVQSPPLEVRNALNAAVLSF